MCKACELGIKRRNSQRLGKNVSDSIKRERQYVETKGKLNEAQDQRE